MVEDNDQVKILETNQIGIIENKNLSITRNRLADSISMPRRINGLPALKIGVN